MLKTKSLAILLLSTSLIAACGGSSSSPAPEVNPFANGNLPKQKESIDWLFPFGSIEFTVDPVNKSFSMTSPGWLSITGTYDPATGVLTAKNCTGIADACEDFELNQSYALRDLFGTAQGDGLVLIETKDTDYNSIGTVFGYNPSDPNNLPTGNNVIYSGLFGASLDDEFANENIEVTGKATTTVDFDNDSLDVKFTELSGSDPDDYASITGASINGSSFSGGELSVNFADGTSISGGETDVYGQFYGEQGQELGGSVLYFMDGGNDGYLSIDGGWTGVKQ